jgi:hypothetical protein
MVQATSVIDPFKPSVLTLTGEEIEEIKRNIAAGTLPADYLQRCDEARALNVFGQDAKRDRNGKFLEQGIGAPGHETANHFAALKANEARGQELPGAYDKAVAAFWKSNPEAAQRFGLPGRK